MHARKKAALIFLASLFWAAPTLVENLVVAHILNQGEEAEQKTWDTLEKIKAPIENGSPDAAQKAIIMATYQKERQRAEWEAEKWASTSDYLHRILAFLNIGGLFELAVSVIFLAAL